jgi:hypothetical protein
MEGAGGRCGAHAPSWFGRRLGGRSDQGQCGTGEHISRRFQVVVQTDQEPAMRVKQKNPGNPHLEFLDELEAEHIPGPSCFLPPEPCSVSLTVARWPLQHDHHAVRAEDLHHYLGRNSR